MAEQHYKVEVQEDHLARLALARPIQAVAELIWNGLDADATKVDVVVESGPLGTQAVVVRDDGHAISHDGAPELFSRLGGSWKARAGKSQTARRMLHGKEGKGRFKAFALGNVVDWIVTYRRDESFFRYTITLVRHDLVDVRISDPTQVAATGTGVEVRITEMLHDFPSLEGASAVQELSEIFALYLSDYNSVRVVYQGQELDPSQAIAQRVQLRLDPILDEDGQQYPAQLELIEWKSATERVIYLCSDSGFPYHRLNPRFQAPGFQFSAYLKSPYVTVLHTRGVLDLAELTPPIQAGYEKAQELIKEYVRERRLEAARSEIEQWKAEQVYPYKTEPVDAVESVERKVFDIVALNFNRAMPDFQKADRRSKAFQLALLRQAIERGPDELQSILSEVLELPSQKRRELATLLEETTLSNLISASKLVADRLKFLQGIEAVLFDSDMKKRLKERSQLHRILAENTWVFGEEFNLTVDDESLTEVLRKHVALLGSDVVIDRPVTKIDGSKGIVDLMLSRAVPRNRAEEFEHLVIELKAPAVKVGAEEMTQIEKYAYAVASDERFRQLEARWNFWVISNELDPFAGVRTQQANRPRGQISQTDDRGLQVTVWVKTWSEVLADCNGRLRFIRERLEYNVGRDRSLAYLQKTYDKYLAGVQVVDGGDSAFEDAPSSDETPPAAAASELPAI